MLRWRWIGARAYCGVLTAVIAVLGVTRALFADESSDFYFRVLSNGAVGYSIDPLGNIAFHVDLGIGYAGDRMFIRGQDLNSVFTGHESIGDGWPESAQRSYDASESRAANLTKYAWVSPTYGQFVGKGSDYIPLDPTDRTNFHLSDFIATRTGADFGIYWSTPDSKSKFGLLGNYSRGRMTQSFHNNPYKDQEESWSVDGYETPTGYIPGYEGTLRYELNDEQKVRAKMNYTDFQFGAQLTHEFDSGIKVDGIIMGGAQRYLLTRRSTLTYDGNIITEYFPVTPEPGMEYIDDPYGMIGWHSETEYTYNSYSGIDSELYSGNGVGNTLSATVTFTKDFKLGSNWTVTPTASFLSVHSWIYRATENGLDLFGLKTGEGMEGRPEWSPTTTAFRPYKLTRTLRYDRNTSRVGAKLEYKEDAATCDVRAYYGTQLGGEDGPTIYGAQAEVENPMEQIIKGVGYGRDSLTLGGGASYTFTGADALELRGDYGTIIYRKARKETVSATATLIF